MILITFRVWNSGRVDWMGFFSIMNVFSRVGGNFFRVLRSPVDIKSDRVFQNLFTSRCLSKSDSELKTN